MPSDGERMVGQQAAPAMSAELTSGLLSCKRSHDRDASVYSVACFSSLSALKGTVLPCWVWTQTGRQR